VAITTNLEFSRWVEVFGGPNLTTALLDRVTHRAKILVFNGESYRFKSKRANVICCRRDRGPWQTLAGNTRVVNSQSSTSVNSSVSVYSLGSTAVRRTLGSLP
jgi:hypothetical protein